MKKLVWASILSLVAICAWLLGLWGEANWNGKDPINVVVVAHDEIWVVAVRPGERRAVEVRIPPNIMVPVAGYGLWQARSIPQLARLVGDSSLVGAVGSGLLGVPIDTVMTFRDWRGRETSYRSIDSRSWWQAPEQLRLIGFMRSRLSHEIETIDLSKLPFARKVIDPSNDEIIQLDSPQLSPLVSSWFEIASLRQDGLTIAIRNASSEDGAGGELAGQLEHVGLRVVSVATGEGKRGIVVSSPKLSRHEIVKRLSGWLKLPVTTGQFDERADVLVVI